MDTILGVKWRIADYSEILIALLIFLIAIAFFILLRYNQHLKKKKIQAEQLFLFKIKQLGLTNFQVKVLDGIIHTLNLPDASVVLKNPGLFESAIARFLSYLKSRGENDESISSICRDLIITYEKLYNHAVFKTPLRSIGELETGILLFIAAQPEGAFIGKISDIKDGKLILSVFRNVRNINVSEELETTAYVWRAGDAEYSFKTKIIEISGNTVDIILPDEFTRSREARHPYVDTIIPCTITPVAGGQTEASRDLAADSAQSAVIHKIHQDELIIRSSKRLDYRESYYIDFFMSDFKMRITAVLIADRAIQEESVFYLTLRYTEISEAARSILRTYIQDHL